MNLRSQFLSIGALLFAAMLPAAAVATGPYLVYSGTITEASDVSAAEATAVQAKVNANLTAFHKVNPNLQRDVTVTASTQKASTDSKVYVIVDEQNPQSFTVVVFDSTGVAGERIASFPTADQSANGPAENFVSGFQFPTRGGLGIFRLGFVQPDHGKDPLSGVQGSLLLQAYGTGAVITTPANAEIVASHVGEAFFSVVNGVKTGAEHNVLATPAITSATGATYIPKITGTVLGYYFDDVAAQDLGGASTSGTFALEIDPTLTHLANFQGEYAYSTKNIGLVTPITASTPAAFKAWAKSIINIAIPPPAP